MKNSKREITLNEYDSLEDMLFMEKSLLREYCTAIFRRSARKRGRICSKRSLRWRRISFSSKICSPPAKARKEKTEKRAVKGLKILLKRGKIVALFPFARVIINSTRPLFRGVYGASPKRPLAFPRNGTIAPTQSGKKDFSRREDGLFRKSRVRR